MGLKLKWTVDSQISKQSCEITLEKRTPITLTLTAEFHQCLTKNTQENVLTLSWIKGHGNSVLRIDWQIRQRVSGILDLSLQKPKCSCNHELNSGIFSTEVHSLCPTHRNLSRLRKHNFRMLFCRCFEQKEE